MLLGWLERRVFGTKSALSLSGSDASATEFLRFPSAALVVFVVHFFDQSRFHLTLALQLEQLSQHFGGEKAVDNLSLEVMPGESLAFLGLNGAGKTTMLRMVAGLA